MYRPYVRKESCPEHLAQYQEFSDEAFEIINRYAQDNEVDMTYGGSAIEIMVCHLLYSESQGYTFTLEQRDYYIKTCMGIIPLDKGYEKEIGYFGQSK